MAARPGLGFLLIALAALSWGTTGSVMTVLATSAAARPLVVGAVRLWVAAVLLALATRLLTGSLRVGSGDGWRCLGMGACMAAYQATYFSAVTLSGIALTALIAICAAPLLIAALATSVLGERLSGRVRLALGLGVVGTGLLVVAPHGVVAPSGRVVAGALLALGAGLAYAVYVVIAKASLVRTAPLPLASATFVAGALLMTPVFFVEPGAWPEVARGWPWLLYLGAIATAGAYAIYTVGLRHVPASVAGVITLLEPLTATGLGVVLFGERLGPTGVVGAVLLGAALALLSTDHRSAR